VTQAPTRPWLSLLGLLIVMLFAVELAALRHALPVALTIGVIAAVIMLHELGHFATAKWAGMKVTEYFLGFGPCLWSVRRGETTYGVKALPAGGYVRIVGMNNLEQVEPADEARSYRQQTFARRVLVVSAGSLVHFALALVTLWVLFGFVGLSRPTLVVKHVERLATGPSPAAAAGVRAGDRIVSFDGIPARNWAGLYDYIGRHEGRRITLGVARDGTRLLLTATPMDMAAARDENGEPLSDVHRGFLGIEHGERTERFGAWSGSVHALGSFWSDGVVGTLKAVGVVFGPHGLAGIGRQIGRPAGSVPVEQATRPSSVVGVVEIATHLPDAQSALALFVTANMFVGIINLFPMLPFDGGHVAIALYERVRSRRGRRYTADVAKLIPYATFMVMVLVVVFVSSLYLDVVHPLSFR